MLKSSFTFNQPIKLSPAITLCTAIFHLQATNYFIFTCLTCGTPKIEQGVQAPANWGGLDE